MKIGFSGLLFLLFLFLKLTGYVAWPWIWVTAPLWIPFAITLFFLAFLGVCLLYAAISDKGVISAKKN